jgi:hypothetical protein
VPLRIDKRARIGLFVNRIAQTNRRDLLDQLVEERVVDAVMQEES